MSSEQQYIRDRVIEEDRGYGTPCWIWQLYVNTHTGYGQTGQKVKDRAAHRVAYTAFVGPIREGLHIDHLCRVRACCNPEHMEPVTIGENIRRGAGPVGINARKSYCDHGHEFTAQNTRLTRNGTRECLACCRERQRILRARRGESRKAARVGAINEALALWHDGHEVASIAAQVGATEGAIRGWFARLRRAGFAVPRRSRGGRHEWVEMPSGDPVSITVDDLDRLRDAHYTRRAMELDTPGPDMAPLLRSAA